VVRHPFGSYQKGDHITDEATVAALLADRDRAGYLIPKSNDEPVAEPVAEDTK